MDNLNKVVAWDVALQRMRDGNTRFHEDRSEYKPNDAVRRHVLTSGQHPFAIILTCADSRVVPEFIFDAGPGDLFVVRVGGNVPDVSSVASIEFAALHLDARLIVVMGHDHCGAVEAAIDGSDYGDNLNHLLAYIKPAVRESTNEDLNTVSRINSRNSASTLVRESVKIREVINNGDVRIVTAFYNMGSGVVDFDENIPEPLEPVDGLYLL